MIFNDIASKQGIIQEEEFILFGDNGYGKISGNSDYLNTFVRLNNTAVDRVEIQILKADGRWQYDDSSFGTTPVGTTNLVTGQQSYQFDSTFLKVLKVRIKDSSGNWQTLYPIDGYLLQNNPTSGTPRGYDKTGDQLIFDVPPNYSSTGGIEVTFQRITNHFTALDTTKEPGFASNFHPLVVKWVCYEYALSRNMSIAPNLRAEISLLEQELRTFYSNRNRDEATIIRKGWAENYN